MLDSDFKQKIKHQILYELSKYSKTSQSTLRKIPFVNILIAEMEMEGLVVSKSDVIYGDSYNFSLTAEGVAFLQQKETEVVKPD